MSKARALPFGSSVLGPSVMWMSVCRGHLEADAASRALGGW